MIAHWSVVDQEKAEVRYRKGETITGQKFPNPAATVSPIQSSTKEESLPIMFNSLRNQVFERYEFKVGDISASIYLQPWSCNEKPGFLSPLRLIKHNR